MSQDTKPTVVIAFIEPGQIHLQVKTALDSDPEFQLVAEVDSFENAAEHVHTAAPDIILVDQQIAGQLSLDLVDELALRYADIPIIALLDGDEVKQAQQYLLAGVRTFMIKPFTQVSLLSTLRRIRELEGRRTAAQPQEQRSSSAETGPLQILTVYSPRGGVGCSTIAINLAVALHNRLDVRVLLMEGKMTFGHLGLMLNFRPQNTIADLIPHAGALDNSLVEEVVSQHTSGIQFLPSSPDLNVGQGIRPNDLYSVIQGASRAFDIIVIDAGSHLDDNTVTLMDAADRVLLVTTPDLAALHDTSRFIQLAQPLGFPPDKVLTVLNRAGIEGGIKIREIEAALHQPLFARVAEGNARVMRSLNRGVPIVIGSSRSKVSKDIVALAEKLSTAHSAVVAQAASKLAQLRRNGRKRPAHSQHHNAALKLLRR
ncbi:MAG: AAA family ATPase [Acidiferrobacterales bacterium]